MFDLIDALCSYYIWLCNILIYNLLIINNLVSSYLHYLFKNSYIIKKLEIDSTGYKLEFRELKCNLVY